MGEERGDRRRGRKVIMNAHLKYSDEWEMVNGCQSIIVVV